MSKGDLIAVDHRHHFIADTHFGHTSILNLAARPYADIIAHDRDIIERWNASVRSEDTVWHLGDFAGDKVPFDRIAEIFGKLNGIKRLITGNHDTDEVRTKLPWESVDDMRTVVAPGCKIVLCHYPMREWDGFHGGDLHFHGHTHDRLPSSKRSWDCGVDHQGFAPATFDAIKTRMDLLPEMDFSGSAVETTY